MILYVLAAAQAVVAVAVAAIAFAAYRVNRNKLKLDLWERRYAVYTATIQFLDDVTKDLDPTDAERGKFNMARAPGNFLFNSDVREYLTALHNKSVDLAGQRRKLEPTTGLENGPERKKVLQQNHDLVTWFSRQFPDGARQAFAPYLDFGNIK